MTDIALLRDLSSLAMALRLLFRTLLLVLLGQRLVLLHRVLNLEPRSLKLSFRDQQVAVPEARYSIYYIGTRGNGVQDVTRVT